MFGLDLLKKKLDIMSGTLYNIEGIVKSIHHKIDLFQDKSGFYFSQFRIDNVIFEGRIEKITMNEFQKVVGHFKALKKNGQPAQVQNPTAETDNAAVATAEITGDGEVTVSAVEGGVNTPTAVLVTVKADADLGDGVREISIVGSLTVTPGEADHLELSFDEPVDK